MHKPYTLMGGEQGQDITHLYKDRFHQYEIFEEE
jgi:hypothetical protein